MEEAVEEADACESQERRLFSVRPVHDELKAERTIVKVSTRRAVLRAAAKEAPLAMPTASPPSPLT